MKRNKAYVICIGNCGVSPSISWSDLRLRVYLNPVISSILDSARFWVFRVRHVWNLIKPKIIASSRTEKRKTSIDIEILPQKFIPRLIILQSSNIVPRMPISRLRSSVDIVSFRMCAWFYLVPLVSVEVVAPDIVQNFFSAETERLGFCWAVFNFLATLFAVFKHV